MPPLRRRTLLALGAWGAAGSLAAACGLGGGMAGGPTRPADDRWDYGPGPAQYADLYRPTGTPRGVVVVLHGGFWSARYDATLGAPLATSLAAEGWAAWNVEYRRVGDGGGVPQTLDDVAAAIDRLADPDLDLGLELGLDRDPAQDPAQDLGTSTVLTLGHSAGGQLAAWAAARGRFERWSPVRVPVTGVLSQAGVLDLRAAAAAGLGGGAVTAFVGGAPDGTVDPAQQLPLDVPVRCVHGRDDTIVPPAQSADYVTAARAAGADAELVPVDGDHFTVIDTGSAAWATQLELLAGLAAPPR